MIPILDPFVVSLVEGLREFFSELLDERVTGVLMRRPSEDAGMSRG
jgi:hypothetical protein